MALPASTAIRDVQKERFIALTPLSEARASGNLLHARPLPKENGRRSFYIDEDGVLRHKWGGNRRARTVRKCSKPISPAGRSAAGGGSTRCDSGPDCCDPAASAALPRGAACS